MKQDENENEEGDEEMVVGGGAAAESDGEGDGARGRAHAFFQRSDSTLCLGCPPPDPFNSNQKLYSQFKFQAMISHLIAYMDAALLDVSSNLLVMTSAFGKGKLHDEITALW